MQEIGFVFFVLKLHPFYQIGYENNLTKSYVRYAHLISSKYTISLIFTYIFLTEISIE